MKLLSIAIPCYNSQDYMGKCIESLLAGGEEVEILVVNDGSSDRTAQIADEYAAKYPTIVKAIHQENGGHGSAVNAGIRNATGLYFKVVDSDDWVNKEAYIEILKTLYELSRGQLRHWIFLSAILSMRNRGHLTKRSCSTADAFHRDGCSDGMRYICIRVNIC